MIFQTAQIIYLNYFITKLLTNRAKKGNIGNIIPRRIDLKSNKPRKLDNFIESITDLSFDKDFAVVNVTGATLFAFHLVVLL